MTEPKENPVNHICETPLGCTGVYGDCEGCDAPLTCAEVEFCDDCREDGRRAATRQSLSLPASKETPDA